MPHYLLNQLEAEVALDVSPESFRQVLDHLHLLVSRDGRPALALVLADPLPQAGRQLPPSHPPFHVPETQLHLPLPCQHGMKKYLQIQSVLLSEVV